jgi:hypothetical protein
MARPRLAFWDTWILTPVHFALSLLLKKVQMLLLL